MKTKTILELAGSPKEHVEKTMELLIEEIKKQESYTVEDFKTFPVEEKDEMFTTFSELDIEFKNLEALYTFCFDFMPSSVDILSPETVEIDAGEFTTSLNDFLATLHQRDNVVRTVNAKNTVLNRNLQAMVENFIKHLTLEPQDLSFISQKTGITNEKLTEILAALEKDGKVKKEGDKFKSV